MSTLPASDKNEGVKLIISVIVAIGALTSILLFEDRRRNIKLQQEIGHLDKNIKQLQLQHLKNGAMI